MSASGVPSVLYDRAERDPVLDEVAARELFVDLNLDQLVEAVTAGRDEYALDEFFAAPATRAETIEHRHAVLRDLESDQLLGDVRAFAKRMATVRRRLAEAEKRYYALQKQRWFLDAAADYCRAVRVLADDLARADLQSAGLRAVRDHVAAYRASEPFTTLLEEAERLYEELGAVRYKLHIKGSQIRVNPYDGEPDYGVEVLRTFERFRQGDVQRREFSFSEPADMNHVEAAVLELIARLNPGAFGRLAAFADGHRDFLEPTIAAFERETQFYLAYLEYIEPLESAGLRFCQPRVAADAKEIEGHDAFDLVLATKLNRQGSQVVCNDYALHGPERILVVTGPNQGGKTTFARMIGQLEYLAALGLPVPGTSARLHLFDRLFTHFERREDIENLTGKLEDDLLRIRGILEAASGRSVVIMNESFSSTTVEDALFLGRQVLDQILQLDMLAVYVTFLDEFASLSEATVSMVSTVDPEDPARRTFRIVRRPADGLAYALALAQKHRLTYEAVKRRVAA